MRRSMFRIVATGAGGLLALGLLAGPSAADGSGNQSKAASQAQESSKVACFQPEGKTQGRSLSDPDEIENGGADKPDPDCTGGVNLDDRDGNNGCGNDDDREDDNNGNCEGDEGQGPDDAAEQPGDDSGDTTTVNAEEVAGDVEVLAAGSDSDAGGPAAEASGTNDPADPAAASAADDTTPAAQPTIPDTQVLGQTLSAPDTLARTGAGVGGLALLGGLLVGGGRLTVLARKLLRIG